VSVSRSSHVTDVGRVESEGVKQMHKSVSRSSHAVDVGQVTSEAVEHLHQ